MHLICEIVQLIILLIIFNVNSNDAVILKKASPSENNIKQDAFIINKTNDANNKLLENSTQENIINNENRTIKPIFPDSNDNDAVSPDILQTGFLICISFGLVAILLISCKAYKMRRTRAERKYGVRGDRSAQELTPLPIAIEDDDSDIEDHTLFDRNRIT